MIKFTYKELRKLREEFDFIINAVDAGAIEFAQSLTDECKRNIKQILLFDDKALNEDEGSNRILVRTLSEVYDFFICGFDIPGEEIFMSIIEKLRKEINKEEDGYDE